MKSEFQNAIDLLSIAARGCGFHRWPELTAALMKVGEAPTNEGEDVLLKIIQSDRRLDVECGPDGPHCMSPEDMLKSLAVQILHDWYGRKHNDVFRKLRENHTGALFSVIDAVLEGKSARDNDTAGRGHEAKDSAAAAL